MAISDSGTSTIMPVAPTGGGFGGFGGYGGDSGFLWLILFFAMFAGNWGWGGNGGGNNGMDFNTLERENDIIRSDLCNGFANVNQTLANGFQGIQTSFANAEISRSNTQAALMGQMYNMSMADLQRGADIQSAVNTGFANTNYNIAQQGCNIQNAIQNSTRDVIDALTAQRIENMKERIDELTRVNSMLTLSNSQGAQSAYLINTLRPYPVPTYTVVAPGTLPDAGAAAKAAVTG